MNWKYWATYIAWQVSIIVYVWISGRLVGMLK
jgi:hypothetical protein